MLKPTDHEEHYFWQQEARRREALRDACERAARELEVREATARAAGAADPVLVDRIHALGFEGENARLLDVLPLILVAWADGSISARERATVMAAVESAGVAPHSEAWLKAAALLETRPSETLTHEILLTLRDLVGAADGRAQDIVERCVRVAEASRRRLGLGPRVSALERETIARIAAQFSPEARAAVEQLF